MTQTTTMSGNGWGTGPAQVLWFCHLCRWAGPLKAGCWHQCKGKPQP